MTAKIGKTVGDSRPHWPEAPKRPEGAPNILVVLFDDVGFSDFGCYGSPIATPTIDALAAKGLRYTGFHTTAMCSTTRAALLTGRNHHSVGVGCLANFDSGYPGYRGKIAREAGTIAEMLRPHGYCNYMLGKWHVTPLTESGATGPFDGWPLGRGFDRFYGFLDAETDQYAPELVRDNTPVDPPGTYGSAYTDAEGKFVLQFSPTKEGAMVARHEVTIRTAAKDEIQVEDRKTGLMVTPPLPDGYKEKVELVFEREVKSGDNVIDFDLTEGRVKS